MTKPRAEAVMRAVRLYQRLWVAKGLRRDVLSRRLVRWLDSNEKDRREYYSDITDWRYAQPDPDQAQQELPL